MFRSLFVTKTVFYFYTKYSEHFKNLSPKLLYQNIKSLAYVLKSQKFIAFFNIYVFK